MKNEVFKIFCRSLYSRDRQTSIGRDLNPDLEIFRIEIFKISTKIRDLNLEFEIPFDLYYTALKHLKIPTLLNSSSYNTFSINSLEKNYITLEWAIE